MNALLSVLLWAAAAGAAEVTINAAVDRTEVALNGQIVLEVSISGPHATLPDPTMPPLKNFSLYSSGSNQTLSFVNGKVASSLVHTFVLVPASSARGRSSRSPSRSTASSRAPPPSRSRSIPRTPGPPARRGPKRRPVPRRPRAAGAGRAPTSS